MIKKDILLSEASARPLQYVQIAWRTAHFAAWHKRTEPGDETVIGPLQRVMTQRQAASLRPRQHIDVDVAPLG